MCLHQYMFVENLTMVSLMVNVKELNHHNACGKSLHHFLLDFLKVPLVALAFFRASRSGFPMHCSCVQKEADFWQVYFLSELMVTCPPWIHMEYTWILACKQIWWHRRQTGKWNERNWNSWSRWWREVTSNCSYSCYVSRFFFLFSASSYSSSGFFLPQFYLYLSFRLFSRSVILLPQLFL